MARAPSPVAFVLLATAAQFAVNFALNAIDHATVARSGEARALHDRASTAARLVGMLSAPLVVPAVFDRGDALPMTVALGGLFAAACAAVALRGAHERATSDEQTTQRAGELSPQDRRVLGFSLAVYVSLYLVAANLIYLLRDVAHLTEPERRGGATLTTVFFGALVGAGVRSLVFSPTKLFPRATHLAAPLPFLVLVPAVLSSGWAVPTVALGVGAIGLGLSYGLFLGALREYVSRGAGEEKRGALLSAFNNLANASSLVAFALLATAAMLTRGRAGGAYPFVMTLAAVLPFAALPLLRRASAER